MRVFIVYVQAVINDSSPNYFKVVVPGQYSCPGLQRARNSELEAKLVRCARARTRGSRRPVCSRWVGSHRPRRCGSSPYSRLHDIKTKRCVNGRNARGEASSDVPQGLMEHTEKHTGRRSQINARWRRSRPQKFVLGFGHKKWTYRHDGTLPW